MPLHIQKVKGIYNCYKQLYYMSFKSDTVLLCVISLLYIIHLFLFSFFFFFERKKSSFQANGSCLL